MLASFDDGKFTKEKCPIVVLLLEGWPPDPVTLTLHILRKDPGNVTPLISPLTSQAELVLIDSITICGLGFVNPKELGKKVIVVSKYVPRIRRAYKAVEQLYGDASEFREIAEEYLRRVKCEKLKAGRRCVAPYGIELEEALEIVRKRTLVEPLPEDVRMAHLIASAIGRWLNNP